MGSTSSEMGHYSLAVLEMVSCTLLNILPNAQFSFFPTQCTVENTSPFPYISVLPGQSIVADYLISRIWDTATGQCLRTLVHEDNAPVTSVRFSRNGKFVLAWTLDSCVRLWNYVEGRCTKTYQGHNNIKFSLTGGFGIYGGSDDDGADQAAFVISGSEDGNILWWDVQSKAILQKETGHEGVVLGVDIWDPESLVVSCGLDKTVRVWEKDDGNLEGEEAINGENDGGGHEDDVDGTEDYHEGDQEVDGEGNEGSHQQPEGGSEVGPEEAHEEAQEGEDDEGEPLQEENDEKHRKSDTGEREEDVGEEDNTEAENESSVGEQEQRV